MKRVVLLGAGGLGCPAALALAESGRELILRIVDDDRVDRSNLARQILFREGDVGQPKAHLAAARLPARVEPVVGRFTASTARAVLDGADVLLDGTDNFETRFAANDAALELGVPLVHGAALGWRGQLLTVLPGETACLRCLFEGPPEGPQPTCAEAGVAGPLCGLVGAAMAEAALDVLDGKRPRSTSALLAWDGRTGTERAIRIPRDPQCRCAAHPIAASDH